MVFRLHQSDAENEIRRALDMPTPENFEFVEQPISAVVEFIEDYYKINVEFDTKAMEQGAATTDTPVNRRLSRLPLSSALDLIFRDLDLDYRIADDVLVITTVDVAQQTTELRVYDVREIHQRGTLDSAAIACMIEKTFTESDGHVLRVVPFDDLLVIRDNQRGHDEIEALLSTLQLALAGGGEPASKKVDAPKQPSFEEAPKDESKSSPGSDPFEAPADGAKPAVK